MSGPSITLVAGATGLLGMRVVRLLREAGHAVRAVVRQSAEPAARSAIDSVGAEPVAADLKVPPSLDNACRGITTVVSTASATRSRQAGDSIETVDLRGQLALVEAARQAGAQRFVFVSFPPRKLDYSLQRAKRAVEAAVRESGMSFTIIQPVSFCEVWLGPAAGFDLRAGKVHLWGMGDKPVSWISVHDVARFAAAAAEGGRFADIELPLGGPDALSQREVVRMVEAMSGKRLTLTETPEDALQKQLDEARDPLEETYAAIKLAMARGLVTAPPPAIELLPGRLTTVREFLGHALRTFGSNTKEN